MTVKTKRRNLMDPLITLNISLSTPEATAALLQGLGLLGRYEPKSAPAPDPAASTPLPAAGPAPVYPPQQPAYSPAPPAAPVYAQQPQYSAPANAAPPAPSAYAPPPAAPTAPVGQPAAYAMEDLSRAAVSLMDAGRQQDVTALLNSFGVQALTQLPPAQYGAFATALRGMGARI